MNAILIALLARAVRRGRRAGRRAPAARARARARAPTSSPLPNGFQPEGITTGEAPHVLRRLARHRRHLPAAACAPARARSSSTGADRPRGAPASRSTAATACSSRGAGSKAIRVYDARTGDEIRSYPRARARGFINDVSSPGGARTSPTRSVQQLYFVPFGKKGALGELQRIPITGDFVYTRRLQRQRHRGGQAAARR